MTFRITILCDNTVGPLSGTLGEHGIAVMVEHPKGSLLFDTGQGRSLLVNAQRMNKDLHSVQQVVLSHGHYDHTGGLLPLLQVCGSKNIYAHPAIATNRYALRSGERSRSIGIPYGLDFLAGQGAQFNFSESPRELAPDLLLTGEVPRSTWFERGDSGIFCDASGCHPDRVPDDQSLVLRTAKGLVLIAGCCHSGLINTIEHVLAIAGTGIYAVIGGMHLAYCSEEQIDGTIKALRHYGVSKICGGHCTGLAASARLIKAFPGKFQAAHVGYTLEI